MSESIPQPTPAEVRNRRTAADLSREDAAAMVYRSARTWEKWEQGTADVDMACWELFTIKLIRMGRWTIPK